MAPPRKTSPTSAARRKSSTAAPATTKQSMVVKLKLSPKSLKTFQHPNDATVVKEEVSPSKAVSTASSSDTPPATSKSDSSDKVPDAPLEKSSNTPDAAAMPPPKKGVKRGVDEVVKVRGKPGPKKRPRREDGTIDHSAPRPSGTSKGVSNPRHNTGAINAGLRALDRTGRACRKWSRGDFRVKSFTGVLWELPSWKAPAKVIEIMNDTPDSSQSRSNNGSSKENKDGSQVTSEKSTGTPAIDVDKTSTPTPSQKVESPPPVVITAS